MNKNMYVQPSVEVTEMLITQTLCVSGGDTPLGGGLNPDATTDEQL